MARAAAALISASLDAQVDDDDLVAETVHLGKGEAGGLCHAPLYGEGSRKHNSPIPMPSPRATRSPARRIPTWERATGSRNPRG